MCLRLLAFPAEEGEQAAIVIFICRHAHSPNSPFLFRANDLLFFRFHSGLGRWVDAGSIGLLGSDRRRCAVLARYRGNFSCPLVARLTIKQALCQAGFVIENSNRSIDGSRHWTNCPWGPDKMTEHTREIFADGSFRQTGDSQCVAAARRRSLVSKIRSRSRLSPCLASLRFLFGVASLRWGFEFPGSWRVVPLEDRPPGGSFPWRIVPLTPPHVGGHLGVGD